MTDFVIPANRDDLLSRHPGQYYVEDVLSTRLIPIKVQDTKNKLIREDGISISDHFEVIFSVVCRFHELDASLKLLVWNTLTKSCERFCSKLHKALGEDSDGAPIWESSEVAVYCNALKMHVYLLVQMSELYQSIACQHSASNAMTSPKKGKRKTKSKASADKLGMDWESECAKSFHILMNFVDLDIHRLWKAQLVEDEFTSLIMNFCYKVLEDQIMIKNKSVRTNAFHLLGCVIKKHNQSLSSSLKIVQMMQHFEHISGPLAEAMELWINSYKCKSLLPETLRELGNIDEKELVRDSVSARTICSFLQEVAKLLPSETLPHVSLLMSRMDEESYLMRNTVLGVFGEILLQCLNGEMLNEKSRSDRDQFLDILYDHANLDCNAFVRSKAVQILCSLVKAEALPMKRCSKVADLGVHLLLDKSNLVRKSAVQLLVELLRWNPFAATLSIGTLKEKLDQAKEKLDELQSTENQQVAGTEEVQANTEDESGSEEKNGDFQLDFPTTPEEVASSSEDSETAKQQKICAFLSDAVVFVETLQEAVPVLCLLLRSHTQTDVLEAINFFTVAWEFKLEFALEGITDMLDQIWHEDQKVRDAVVYAYKEFYFKPNNDSESPVQQIVDNMVHLAAGSSNDKLEAVEALICEMNKTSDMASGVPQVLWSRFVTPSSAFTMSHGVAEEKQRKVIAQLLGMFAKSDPQFLKSKVSVLVDVGLVEGEVPATKMADFELAMNTCNTLLKLSEKKVKAGTYTEQIRFPNDSKMFLALTRLIVKGFTKDTNTWINFAFSALSVIFQLAAKPTCLATDIFNQLKTSLSDHTINTATNMELNYRLLSRFFSICGHIALKLLIFIDGDVQSEIKRRRKLEEEEKEAAKKKKKSKRKSKTPSRGKNDNLEEEMGVGGATADDADQELIKNVLETEIVGPSSLMGSVTEILVRACSVDVGQDNLPAVQAQASASIALSKYMLVSSEFCEKHMRLFFTMLQSSKHECIRANLTLAAGDLCVQFPNIMEPWTANLYARLNDTSTLVRIYAIKVLTNLILHDMIKVKGHVSEMAKCIADENTQISMLAKRFFQELSKKGNAVYNVMPDIISRLSDPEVGVKDDVDFKSIMTFLFDFIQKDKQSESLVEKLCHRFKATREVQQWRDLAYCLSLLNYNEKAVKKLIENFSFYSEVLRDEQVYYSFDTIISKSKKFAKPELKVQIEELERKLLDHHAQGLDEDKSAARAAEASKKHNLPRSQSVSQPSAGLSPKKFSLVRRLSVPCRRISVSPKTPIPIPPRRRESEGNQPTCSVPKRPWISGNKRMIASVVKSSRKKRRESWSEDEVVERAAETRRMNTRRVNKKTVEFSSDDDDENDAKENINVGLEDVENDDPGLNISQISNASTPIRRKKTPKRIGSKSLRV